MATNRSVQAREANKYGDLKRRLVFLLLALVVFRIGTHIPVPGINPDAMAELFGGQEGGVLGLFNLFSGGALSRFSVFALGIMPYISASIIMQLLTVVVPSLEQVKKEGEAGRRIITKYTRWFTLALATFQALGISVALESQGNLVSDPGFMFRLVAVISLVTGTMFLMWLGEQITERGLGNGISLIIFSGIVSGLPGAIGGMGSLVSNGNMNPVAALIIMALVILVTAFVVFIERGQRRITINYAKRVHGNSNYGGIKSILPVKLIAAGVIPVIFAVAFLSLPQFIGQIMKASGNEGLQSLANTLITWFQAPNPGSFTGSTAEAFIYPVLYFILVIAFTYFYTGFSFDTTEISEGLQKQGGFIEGVRPGKQTEEYLRRTVNRLVLFGSLALGVVAILPFVAEYLIYHITGLTGTRLSIGGTGILIIVSVALESIRQISSRALMVTYDDFDADDLASDKPKKRRLLRKK